MKMRHLEFRYNATAQWFKGNTHIHSTRSDGGKDFGELAALYAGAGYDFLFRTDHWIASDAASDTQPYPLLWLDGIELDGVDTAGALYHVVCLGAVRGLTSEMGFVDALEAARAQGALLILAHPHWSGNSLDEATRWGFHGVEVYNHVCQWLNGKGDGSVYWSAMLTHDPDTLAFAVDDAHLVPEHPGWNGGWIMVSAAVCSPEAILNAIARGCFYSTCGPEFHTIQFDGQALHISTSPVQFARLVGPRYLGHRVGGYDGRLLTQAAFKIPTNWDYAYLEIEDDRGRRAWTNTLFTERGRN
jgi:hypothetical protein